ncbi:hypothetical protein PGTUg99_022311 [Puccinia graminis f. sp. tritici]|uniref:BED-type domain-containing protein n=1 Tax=Puccinia graminis f. sp. tritici TaxID=56615 RepID=A0A5B0P161_PUCGR|nr:hypothetical protein PGTUg99_022311 [Puccinia graminis f. sp. tritici]
MASTRKRHKPSCQSSTSSSPAVNVSQSNTSEPYNESNPGTGDLTTPSSTQHPPGINHDTSDREELKKARRVAANPESKTYRTYMEPELSDQRDKHNRQMIAYPCKICGTRINQPNSDSSCSNLNKHSAICHHKQSQMESNQTLAQVGVKGTGDINLRDVNQLCAIWCAEAARPFSALVDASHQALLHPMIKRSLPGRQTISTDIHMLYSATQQDLKNLLELHTGSLYLGVDAWQSPNGFDILGTVVYQLDEDDSGNPKLLSFPLDFVRLSRSHTGKYLAETVSLVVDKFGIQDKV